MQLIVLQAPATEPVSLTTAKFNARIDHDEADTMIMAFILMARQQAELRARCALVTQQWRVDMDFFPPREIWLPKPPLESVQSITYLDDDGARQTLDQALYQVVATDHPGWVLPAYGQCWPSCRPQPGSIQVSYTAGRADNAQELESARQWIMLAVGYMFDRAQSGEDTDLPPGFFSSLLAPYADVRFPCQQ